MKHLCEIYSIRISDVYSPKDLIKGRCIECGKFYTFVKQLILKENMVYTVGHTELYNDYFERSTYPKKKIGGSVWETQKDAENYLLQSQTKNFSVYGVIADWNIDTVSTPHEWRALSKDSLLVKLCK